MSRISSSKRFSATPRCRWNGPTIADFGAKLFSTSRSAIATARSCSISLLRRTTVCSSSVILAIRSLVSIASPAIEIEPDRDRARVRIEPLGFGEGDRRWTDRAQARRVARDQRGALHEIEHAEAGGKPRAACRRQHVIGPRDIIADRFGGVTAQEERAGMADARRELLRLGERHLDMLGGDAID